MNETQYSWFTRPHRRALRQLRLNLEYFIEDCGNVSVFSITDRVKAYASAIAKSQRLKISIHEMQDIAGLRVIVATHRELEVLANFITHEQWLERAQLKSDEVIQKDNGYRARHIVAELRGRATHSMYSALVEIQLQTILEHAFNFLSRAWVYKSDSAFPEGWRRQFISIADHLRDIDSDIAKLHSALLEAAVLSRDADALTPFSFQSIVGAIV